MDVTYNYVFEKMGSLVPDEIRKNVIWIDVGNTVKDGVFDHHQGGDFKSAFECVMKSPKCYESLKSYLKSGEEKLEVEFHVHESPDVDCFFGIYAVQKMISENKENPAEALKKEVTDKLLDYVNSIDEGRNKNLDTATLYAYICMISGYIKRENPKTENKKYMDEVLQLLDLVVKKLETRGNTCDINFFKNSLKEYVEVSTLSCFSKLEGYIGRDCYKKDKDENRVEIELVKLWNSNLKKMVAVKSAIWKELPSGEDGYYFARVDDECLLTVYPTSIKEEKTSEGVTYVKIALDPTKEDAQNYSLKPLAEVIEQCEQIEEKQFYEQTGRYRRDHSKSRKDNNADKEGRFEKIPFCETSDPWFFMEKGDMIDAPRDGSIIPYNRIVSIIKNTSWLTKSANIIQYCLKKGEQDEYIDVEKSEKSEGISFGDLYGKIKPRIKEDQYLLVFVKIDPSMLSHSNSWLKACCMNMVGKSTSGSLKSSFLQIDYRTCLYTDQSITILVTTDGQNQSLSNLVKEGDFVNSPICKDMKNILEHRYELRSIGKGLSEKLQEITQKSKELEHFNERLVHLNTEMEEEYDLITDPLEQSIYKFIKDTLNIESLKKSVTTSAQLLIKNAEQMWDEKKEKQDERIQAGIGLVTIFAVISALGDVFDYIAKFIPGDVSGWREIYEFKLAFVVAILFTVVIIILGVIAIGYALQAYHKTKNKGKEDTEGQL